MKITAINTNFYNQKIKDSGRNSTNPMHHSQSMHTMPMYHYPAFIPGFEGLRLENEIIKKVTGKKSIGLGIYAPNKINIDFLKIGYSKLSSEKFDITKASAKERTAYRFSMALAEGYLGGEEDIRALRNGTTWVSRYNPKNRRSPLAVSHTLNSEYMTEEIFAKNLEFLTNKNLCKSLDIPLTNRDGSLAFDFIVFDTETTGTKKEDKIIQLASVQVKKGKLPTDESLMYNKLIDPEMPIPEEASRVNGITDEMVNGAPTIEAVLKEYLTKHMKKENGIIVAYNSKFDIELLNRAIRTYRKTNNITEGQKISKVVSEKQLYKVLDPFILIQRIHPFLGAKKKLADQYQWLFCKEMEDAHDALADVKGTIDVLKYCLYYIDKHRVDKSRPLTLREVLAFQNGSQDVLKSIDIPLSKTRNCNSNVNFKISYPKKPLNVDNYFVGYKLTKDTLEELAPLIGKSNVAKLENDGLVNELIDLTYKGHKQNPAETQIEPKTGGYENAFYKMKSNAKKVFGYAKLEAYNGRTKEEIEDLLLEKSKLYLHNTSKGVWLKNVNPEDIPKGNDLPDDEISIRVMKEHN